MSNLGSPATNNVGRLEMFREGKWGSVCSVGFNDRSAQVACRSMGFITGKFEG